MLRVDSTGWGALTVDRSPDPTGEVMTQKLRLTGHRRPLAKRNPAQRDAAQVEAFCKWVFGEPAAAVKQNHGSDAIEMVDVIDGRRKRRYQLLLAGGSGSGALYANGTTRAEGTVVQHGLTTEDPDLYDPLGRAIAAADWLDTVVNVELDELPSPGAPPPRAFRWGELKHFDGSAEHVPGHIRTLASRSEDRRIDAYDTLEEWLVGNNRWCKAADPAIETLLASLPATKAEAAPRLWLAAEIAGAPLSRMWARERAHGPPKRVTAAITRHAGELWKALSSKRPDVRAAVPMVLATVPGLAAQSLPRLKEIAAGDPDVLTRVSALLALARLGEGDDQIRTLLTTVRSDEAEPAALRGAAAFAMLRNDLAAPPDQDLPGLALWLGWDNRDDGPEDTFSWFAGGSELSKQGRGLVALAQAREMELSLVTAAASMSQTCTSKSTLERLEEVVLELSGLRRHAELGRALEPGRLTAGERRMVEVLADAPLFAEVTCGLVACGPARRRWLGLDEPRVMDRLVEHGRGKRKRRVPMWYDLKSKFERVGKRGINEVISNELTVAERWEVVVHLLATTYCIGGWHYLAIEPEVARLPSDPDFYRQLEPVLLELVPASRDSGVRSAATELYLAPRVRAGLSLGDDHVPFLDGEDADLLVEVLPGFPRKQRGPAAIAALEGSLRRGHSMGTMLDDAVTVLDALPMPELAAWIWATLDTLEERFKRRGGFPTLKSINRRRGELRKLVKKSTALRTVKLR